MTRLVSPSPCSRWARPRRRSAWPSKDAGAAWGAGGGRGQVAVCDADEDTLTLAWEAADAALDAAGDHRPTMCRACGGAPPGRPSPKARATPFSPPTLGLDADRGGGAAAADRRTRGWRRSVGAWDALAAGHADIALVVISDALVPGLGTAAETTRSGRRRCRARPMAEGAPAVLSPSGSVDAGARPVPGRRRHAAVDRYRPDGGVATGDVYRPLMAVPRRVFVAAAAETGGPRRRGERRPPSAPGPFADPDGKLASAAGQALGAPAPLGRRCRRELGDTGAAAALLGLVRLRWRREPEPSAPSATAGARPPRSSSRSTTPVPGADSRRRLGSGRAGRSPTSRRCGRGASSSRWTDPVPMGLPPGGAAFVRGNPEMLGLVGARCQACGTISTPPSVHPTCIGCGGDDLEVVPLARRGTRRRPSSSTRPCRRRSWRRCRCS